MFTFPFRDSFAFIKAFLVGERGPEIMIPRTAGTIAPNGAIARIGGGAVVNQSISINVAGSAGTPAQNSDLTDRIMRSFRESAQGMLQRARPLRGRADDQGAIGHRFGERREFARFSENALRFHRRFRFAKSHKKTIPSIPGEGWL